MTEDKKKIYSKGDWVGQVIVVLYLLAWLTAISCALYSGLMGDLKNSIASFELGFVCVLLGSLGGCFYCLRAVYLNFCVHMRWGNEWITWYLLRPITSAISGGVAFILLKAGLLILDTENVSESSHWGYYSIAIIAGMNVDNFIKKVEDVFKAVLGITPSRQSSYDS